MTLAAASGHDMNVAYQLTSFRAAHVLIEAAFEKKIIAFECAMPLCSCPDGRGYFEKRGNPFKGPWAPSADRYPLPGRFGGEYTTDNVRLAHWRCNNQDGGRAGTEKKKAYARSPEGRAAKRRAGQAQPLEAKRKGGRLGGATRAVFLRSEEARPFQSRAGKIGIKKMPREILVQNGLKNIEALTTFVKTEKGRAGCVRGGTAQGTWARTEAGRVAKAQAGKAGAAWTKTEAGRKQLSRQMTESWKRRKGL